MLAKAMEKRLEMVGHETVGGTYGVSAGMDEHRDGELEIVLRSQVENRSVKRMAVEVGRSWRDLDSLPAEDELNRMRWSFAEKFNVMYLDAPGLARGLAWMRLRGLDPRRLADTPKELMQVSAQQVSDLGRQCKRTGVVDLSGVASVLPVEDQLGLPAAHP
jgi:hypothetical protein